MSFGLHLIPAHSVVALAEKFAERIRLRADPFLPETVLIMNYAQKIWLQRFLAERNGVCANVRFLSPEAFLEERIFRDGGKRFAREPLAWRVFAALKKMSAEGAGTPPEFLFELSRKPEEEFFRRAVELSDLFWRYQNFRPRMIRAWTNGEPEPRGADADFLQEFRRQKNLWNRLAFGGALPPAEAWLRLLESAEPIAGAPPRVFAFAPSALPRLHFELLEKLAESSDVFLYYHNLSRDLWTESRDEKKRLRERSARGNAGDAESCAALAGNELLAAWGKAARPLAERLIDAGALDADSAIDAPPERDSLLHALQREIRDNAAEPTPFVPAEDDRSLRVAAAPNPLREMEILRDELTARFAAEPALKPRDVLVSFPDLETYAPFIRAAFENSGIPFSVADRSGAEIFPAAAALLEILRVARGEFRLDEALSLLDAELVRRNLGLNEEEISPLRETLGEAGIRWGLDADFRRERIFGKNPRTESAMREKADALAENNSWEFGLRRLALGFMCGNDGGDDAPLALGGLRVSPVPDLAENAPEAIGKIFRLLGILAELNRAFADETPRSVPAWCDFLQALIADGLLDAGGGEADVLRAAFASMRQAAEDGLAGFVGNGGEDAGTCRFRTFAAALETRDWNESGRGGGMLRGKVTFCRMQPLRNIPAKIVCIAGLSDGAFPRASARSRRDLLSFRPKNFPAGEARWDRTPRDEDCLLFLESILAARDALLLSYVARAQSDGQIVPPCVPLAKLRDFLLRLLPEEPRELGAPRFETLHRLHGFSPEYFSEDAARSRKFFSFSRADYATARRGEDAEEEDGAARAAGSGGFRLAPPAGVPETVSARDLARFFVSPAKFICRELLNIAPKSVPAIPENEDPQELFSALDVSRMHRVFFENRLAARERGETAPAGIGPEIFRARELAAGRTPALAEDGKFAAALAAELKDAENFSAFLPARIFRVPEEEIPTELPPEITGAPFGVRLSFERLFRDEAGALFLALAGKKRADWRVAAECFVCAQMLAAAFPREAFSVAYFAYGEKAPLRVTDASLRRSRMTPRELLAFFAEKISAPPLLFEKTPLVSEKTDEDEFFAKTRKEWLAAERDVCEEFVFGGNAPDEFEENVRRRAFPFVRAVCAAFERDAEKPPEKKRRAKR